MADGLKLIQMTGKDDDPAFGFVYSAMRDSLRHQSDLSDAEYYKSYGAEIARLLKDPDTQTMVLVYDDPLLTDEYLGFIVTIGDELIYVYVKSAFRCAGLADWMLNTIGDIRRVGKYRSNVPAFQIALEQRGIQ